GKFSLAVACDYLNSRFARGRARQFDALDGRFGRADTKIAQRPDRDVCFRRFADSHEGWIAGFADALDDAEYGGQFRADGLPALFDDSINAHAPILDLDLASQPKHRPSENARGLCRGDAGAVIERLTPEHHHVHAANLLNRHGKDTRRA